MIPEIADSHTITLDVTDISWMGIWKKDADGGEGQRLPPSSNFGSNRIRILQYLEKYYARTLDGTLNSK